MPGAGLGACGSALGPGASGGASRWGSRSPERPGSAVLGRGRRVGVWKVVLGLSRVFAGVGCAYVWGSGKGSRPWIPNAAGRSPGPGRRARREAARAAEARGSPSCIDLPRLAGLVGPLSLTRVSQHCVIPWRLSPCRGVSSGG